ncbi:MAG: MarR family transcriptional regulator [Acetobacteraceae bacterium]|nr:MarR family transcriptional regulator [Acetobacteraceae bacterium]
MTESRPGFALLYLREEEIRLGMELLFFGYRGFTAGPDAVLEKVGLGRAHHRALYFIGRNPGLSVSDLLSILGITKQSLARVLKALQQEGFVAITRGPRDGRQRLLRLTEKGAGLEREAFEAQRATLARAYREAGPAAVDGFRRVLRGLAGAAAASFLDEAAVRRGPGSVPPGAVADGA